jgi:prepilin-type N-terminal cleavage/methylation domain-containing protein
MKFWRFKFPLEKRGRRGAAFTLVEVLVAMAITAVIAGFMVMIVSNVSGFWGRTSGRLSAEAQGRYILEQLTVDLQAALFRDDNATWLAATIPASTTNTGLWNTTGTTAPGLKPANNAGSLQGIAVGNLADARFGIAGTWLRFFTTKRGANTSLTNASAPVAVAYQIVRRATSTSPLSTDRRYLLHRSEVRPTSLSTTRVGTLETGFDLSATAYAPQQNNAQPGDPAEIKYPTINSVIGENVIDLGVRFYVRDSTTTDGLRRVFPLTASTLSYAAKSPSALPNATDPFPDVIDVMVRVLTDEGARIIAGYEASPQRITVPAGVTAQTFWWQLALANSQVFTRRIVVNAKPL